jgi:hypothetical protein
VASPSSIITGPQASALALTLLNIHLVYTELNNCPIHVGTVLVYLEFIKLRLRDDHREGSSFLEAWVFPSHS